MYSKIVETRTEIVEKRQVMAYFGFKIWIQRGQIINTYLFSSRGKTHILNLFFSVIIVIVPLLPFVK